MDPYTIYLLLLAIYYYIYSKTHSNVSFPRRESGGDAGQDESPDSASPTSALCAAVLCLLDQLLFIVVMRATKEETVAAA